MCVAVSQLQKEWASVRDTKDTQLGQLKRLSEDTVRTQQEEADQRVSHHSPLMVTMDRHCDNWSNTTIFLITDQYGSGLSDPDLVKTVVQCNQINEHQVQS